MTRPTTPRPPPPTATPPPGRPPSRPLPRTSSTWDGSSRAVFLKRTIGATKLDSYPDLTIETRAWRVDDGREQVEDERDPGEEAFVLALGDHPDRERDGTRAHRGEIGTAALE